MGWARNLVVLAAIVLTSSAELYVKFSAPSSLSFTLTGFDDRSVGGVLFKYSLNRAQYSGRGVRVSEGWQYATRTANVGDAQFVSVVAEVYDVNGNVRYVTPETVQRLGSDVAVRHAQLPSRQIRAAVVFRDDFNTFDTNQWSHEVSMYGGYNWEFQVYTNLQSNVFSRNGQLYIKPTLTTDDPRFDEAYLHTGVMDMNALFGTCTNADRFGCYREGKDGILPPVMSGRINSAATLKYGTVEIRARIPKGDWLWPAIWMLPKNSVYGGWPQSGEIDIMESRGNLGPLGIEAVSSTLHWGPSPAENKYYLTSAEKHSANWFNSFHTWRLEWTPDHLITFIDNQEILRVDPGSSFWQMGGFNGNNIWDPNSKMSPFDQEFYMILNVAVGGTNGFFPDGDFYPTTKPWDNSDSNAPQKFWSARNDADGWLQSWVGDDVAMIIDYVEFRSLL